MNLPLCLLPPARSESLKFEAFFRAEHLTLVKPARSERLCLALCAFSPSSIPHLKVLHGPLNEGTSARKGGRLFHCVISGNHRALASHMAQPSSIFSFSFSFSFKQQPVCLKVLRFHLEFIHPYRELVLPTSTYMSA